jgi:hypothetical protein
MEAKHRLVSDLSLHLLATNRSNNAPPLLENELYIGIRVARSGSEGLNASINVSELKQNEKERNGG